MLLRFKLDNWMSFGHEATFSMIASRERQHRERLPRLERYHLNVLPVAAVYGGNASGKTNFFKALNFARNFVVRGTQPSAFIGVDPFRLDANAGNRPTRFVFELLAGEDIYEYDFAVTARLVLHEKLTVIRAASERTLFDRQGSHLELDPALRTDQFLQFAFRGTRPNQLFVTNAVSQGHESFKPVFDWFASSLDLVAPDARFEPFEHFGDDGPSLLSAINRLLPGLDTGILRLDGEDIELDSLPLPESFRALLRESVTEHDTVSLSGPGNERIVVNRRNGQLSARKLVTYHSAGQGAAVKFELRQESDGSLRVIDLLPAFCELTAPSSQKVFVIDELDRSLHTLLTRRLIEAYLESCGPESRAQLLFTTHDVLLMDQDLLRRDEMWVAERTAGGQSTLTSFSEYKDVRNDRDLQKSYLQGRLGGVPRILVNESARTTSLVER